jgi:transposase
VKQARELWHEELFTAGITDDDLVFIDECAATTQMTRDSGRCQGGVRLVAPVPAGHWKVLTTIAALTSQGILTAVTVNAATDAEVFRQFINEALVPALRPGQTVVMDNLSSHKAAGIREAIEAAGCRLLYLPPYSPDYNPIENAIFKIKSHLKKLAARTVESLGEAIQQAMKTITRSDAVGFFQHAGYAIAMREML